MDKPFYIMKLATSFMVDVPEMVVTKEMAMNYYIHQYNEKRWDELTVNDVLKAVKMAGKKVKGNSTLEINVTLKEQLEFYNQTARIFNGRKNRYGAGKILEKNKELVSSCFRNNIPIEEIAENFQCSVVTLRRYLNKIGVRQKRNSKKVLA